MPSHIHLVHCITRYEVSNRGIGHTDQAAVDDFRRQFAEMYLHDGQSPEDRRDKLELMDAIAEELISTGGYAGDDDGNYVFHLETVQLPDAI